MKPSALLTAAAAALLAGAAVLAWSLLRAPEAAGTSPVSSGKTPTAAATRPVPAATTRPVPGKMPPPTAPGPNFPAPRPQAAGANSATTPADYAMRPLPTRPVPGLTPGGRPVLPLAFEEPAPGAASLPPEIESALLHVQDNFIAAIGGENANPATSEYNHRWFNAQRRADMELRARIGGQAFMSLLRARRDKELQEQAAGLSLQTPAH